MSPAAAQRPQRPRARIAVAAAAHETMQASARQVVQIEAIGAMAYHVNALHGGHLVTNLLLLLDLLLAELVHFLELSARTALQNSSKGIAREPRGHGAGDAAERAVCLT